MQHPKLWRIDRIVLRNMYQKHLQGWSNEQLAARYGHGRNAEVIGQLLANYLKRLYRAETVWERAEQRCRDMALEIRLLRLGRVETDQPLTDLHPNRRHRLMFEKVGIATVHQLRSVTKDILDLRWKHYNQRGFPRAALNWAILVLDHANLTHMLVSQRRRKRDAL